MLYTLHWLLLDAASECEVPLDECIHPLSSIQLFVYLFVPLLHQVEKKHFTSLKLQKGLNIWQPLWNHQQPAVIGMCTPVKPKQGGFLTAEEKLRTQTSAYSIYAGSAGGPPESDCAGSRPSHADLSQATVFDVAVLQCLMNARWSSKGVLWGLQYFSKRLTAIAEYHLETQAKSIRRSRSLPTIQVSLDVPNPKLEPSMKRSTDDEQIFKHEGPYANEQLQTSKRNKASLAVTSGADRSTLLLPLATQQGLQISEDSLADIEEEQDKNAWSSRGTESRISAGGHMIQLLSTHINYDQPSSTDRKLITPLLKVTPPTAPSVNTQQDGQDETHSRCKSEPDLLNAPEFLDEVRGSTHYIEDNGTLSYSVVLKALHLIMLNSSEQDIAYQVLNVINSLLKLGVISSLSAISDAASGTKHNDTENFQMAMEIVIRCIVCMGCPTCSHYSTPSTGGIRQQSAATLISLQKANNESFCKYFTKFATKRTLDNIVDFFHSFMNFCTHGHRQVASSGISSHKPPNLYATNFGHSISGEGYKGVEGVIVVQTLKIFVSRLSTALNDPLKTDHVRLYHNSRKFLNYVQEVHGGTFRCVAFSGLIDPTVKLKGELNAQKTRRPRRARRTSRPLIRGNSMPGRKAVSDAEQGADSSANEDNETSCNRASKSDVEDAEEEETKRPPTFLAISHATLALIRARKKVKDHIKAMSARQAQQASGADVVETAPAQPDTTGTSRRMSDVGTSRVLSSADNYEKRLVDLQLIRSGMLRFSLLLDVSQPGSLPEPEFLAALLDLDAPVAARAALLLECAYYVNQCNQGNWPSWMQCGANVVSRSPTFRRTITLQRTAAALFYKWAEALGIRLASLMESEGIDLFSVISDHRNRGRTDAEEDFLDDAAEGKGKSCPHALKMMAALLILEITAFLRETYQHLPVVHPQCQRIWNQSKTIRRVSNGASPSPSIAVAERSVRSSSPTSMEASQTSTKKPKRWALVSANLSQIKKEPVRSQKVSMISIDRRTSGLFGSTSSINSAVDAPQRKVSGSGLTQKHKKLSGLPSYNSQSGNMPSRSVKQSFKLISRAEQGARSITRKPSMNQVSSGMELLAVDESSVFLEDDAEEEVETYTELYEDLHNKLNWLMPIINLASASNFICSHSGHCHQFCFARQSRSCQHLASALENVYSATVTKTSAPTVVRTQPQYAQEKRASVSRILLSNVMEATIGKRKGSEKVAYCEGDSLLPKPSHDPPPIIVFLRKYASNMMSVPLSILTKSAATLREDELINTVAIAWELLLQEEKETAAAAAALILVAAMQIPVTVQSLMLQELHHDQAHVRINAVRRFYVLWTYRHQVWTRLEPGAHAFFKVMPPSIDYTLPSPPIGLPGQIVPDQPWMPLYKLKLEELAANQEGSKSLVTATNTRRKQQQEMVAKALVAEECRKREARESFPLTTVAVHVHAAQELTTQSHKVDDDEDVDEIPEVAPVKEVVTANAVFPSCVCFVGLALFDLLEDSESCNGASVSSAVESVLWNCIIEDPFLFFRYLFEKLTNLDKRTDMFMVLRKLTLFIPDMPSNAAYILINSLVGYVLFYNRSTSMAANTCISQALSVIWRLVENVEGLYFKDLKATLKKVQSEQTLMVTSHLPSTKHIVVHGVDNNFPPQQFPVHDDTQFSLILQESLPTFHLTDDISMFQLTDAKTGRMLSPHSYIRDFYVFKRSTTPQLKIVRVRPDKALEILQKQLLDLKFNETGKVQLATHLLKHSSHAQMENQVLFLHEEFAKQVAFPRRALECEFSFYTGPLGQEMYGTDMTHKLAWLQFLNTLFQSMPGTFGWTNEMNLFLNVVNGCFLLHCEDTSVLRVCIALYLNVSRHFKQVFCADGFLRIIPMIIKVYIMHLNYPVVKSAITYLHCQFHKLHRQAYLLQFLGSYEPFLTPSNSRETTEKLTEQLYVLLSSLENPEIDKLGIQSLLWSQEQLETLDFCYKTDEEFKVLDAINTAITVVAYQTESMRATQMLVILEAVMPYYVKSIIQSNTNKLPKDKMQMATEELLKLNKLAQSIKALVLGADSLMRALVVGQHRLLDGVTSLSGMRLRDADEALVTARTVEEARDEHQQMEMELQELYSEFRGPRDSLLNLVAAFLTSCISWIETKKVHLPESLKVTPANFLDTRCHERLEEVAHALLKVGTYDPQSLSCKGLQRYMLEILPEADWSHESMKSYLNVFSKRLERIIMKVHKRAEVKFHVDWDALAVFVRGICLMLDKQPTLHHLPHIKSLVNQCITLVLEHGLPSAQSAETLDKDSVLPNHAFCSMVAKLAAQHASMLGETSGIEQLCGGVVPSSEKAELMLVNFIIPLCLRVGGNDSKTLNLPGSDIRFILCLLLSSLVPHTHFADLLKVRHPDLHPTVHLHLSHNPFHYGHAQPVQSSDILKRLAFVGLKALLICCERQLNGLLSILCHGIIEVGEKCTGLDKWRFFDFLVTARPPLYILIKPYIHTALLRRVTDTEQEFLVQKSIQSKVNSLPQHTHHSQLLRECSSELDILRNEIALQASGEAARLISTPAPQSNLKRRFSSWRKSSLISKMHDEHASQSEHTISVVDLSAIRPAAEEVDTPSNFNLRRSLNVRGSRHSPKESLKQIHASDGAKHILDKFNNNQPPLPAHEALFSNKNRRGRGVRLIRQTNIIQEEEATSDLSVPQDMNGNLHGTCKPEAVQADSALPNVPASSQSAVSNIDPDDDSGHFLRRKVVMRRLTRATSKDLPPLSRQNDLVDLDTEALSPPAIIVDPPLERATSLQPSQVKVVTCPQDLVQRHSTPVPLMEQISIDSGSSDSDSEETALLLPSAGKHAGDSRPWRDVVIELTDAAVGRRGRRTSHPNTRRMLKGHSTAKFQTIQPGINAIEDPEYTLVQAGVVQCIEAPLQPNTPTDLHKAENEFENVKPLSRELSTNTFSSAATVQTVVTSVSADEFPYIDESISSQDELECTKL